MHSIGVMLEGNQQLGFLFKNFKNCDEAYKKLSIKTPVSVEGGFPIAGTVEYGASEISDDYGQVARIRLSAITAVWMVDLDKDQEMVVERNLHQARSQVMLNRKAQSDPMLKASALVSGDLARMNGPMRMS